MITFQCSIGISHYEIRYRKHDLHVETVVGATVTKLAGQAGVVAAV